MKRAQQKAAMEHRIKMAFVQLLNDEPADKITVTQIAKTANIDRKTFYLHYDTVSDIYRQIENGIVESVRDLLAGGKIKDWREFIVGINDIMKRDFEFYSVVSRKVDLAYIEEECTGIITKLLRQSLLSDRQANFKDKMMIRYAAMGITGVYTEWLKTGQKVPLSDVIDVLSDALNQTLADYLN